MGLMLAVLLVLGLPIGLVLGATGLFWLTVKNPVLLGGAARAVMNLSTSDVLLSLPLFILMGLIVQKSDVARKFYSAVALWLRGLPGGLLHTNIAVCSMFSAISGSSVATAATVGSTAIPTLLNLKYDKKLMSGSLAAGGTLGILIPPSIPLIVYGATVQESIGQLFIAATMPALMMIGLFSIYILIRALLNPGLAPVPPQARITTGERLRSILDLLPLTVVAVVVIGGIYRGWTTATEAAALGLATATLVAAVTRSLTLRMLREALLEAVSLTAVLMFIVVGATVFSFAIFSWSINSTMANMVADLPLSPLTIMLMIAALYVVLGMFIDPLSLLLMTVSVMVPIIVELGYDPIWFGVVLVILIEIGMITPPVGMNLFTIQAISPRGALSIREVSAGSLPFVGLMMILCIILILFPGIVLWPLSW
jgi:tripartite ATP-independent transporter DctM subunit